jgi:hypothetical protein
MVGEGDMGVWCPIPHSTLKSQRCGDKRDKATRISKQWSIDQRQENQRDSTEAKLTRKGINIKSGLLYLRSIVIKTGGVEEDVKRHLLLLLLLLLSLLNANGFIPGDNVIQCKTGHYNTGRYNTIIYNDTHHTITQHSRRPSIHKITKKIKSTHYTQLILRTE